MTNVRARTSGWNRFAGVSRPVAALVLAMLAALMLLGLDRGEGVAHHVNHKSASSLRYDGMLGDHALYLLILRRVEAGQSYYTAAAAEQRAHRYPTRPFMVVRPPTLNRIMATIGLPNTVNLCIAIGLAAVIAWGIRLRREGDLPVYVPAAVMLLMVANMLQLAARDWVMIHEVIAGALIALALALYRPERPWWTMAIVAIALAIRETVLPVAALLGLFALIDRNWKAVASWLAIGIAFAIGMALHAAAVDAVARPGDLASPAWDGMGGWTAYLSFLQNTSGTRFLPVWATALLAPLALLGWAAWKSRLGTIGFLMQAGYAVMYMLFARSNNFYWAMMIAPTLFIGLAFAPAALVALVRSLAPVRASVSPAGM